MAYPPTVPPNNRADNTPLPTNHIGDHNDISNALTDIINELGSSPKGASASVTARLDVLTARLDDAGAVQIASSGPASVQRLHASKLEDFVYFEGYASGSTAGVAIPGVSFPVDYRPVTAAATCFARLNNGGTITTGTCDIGTSGIMAPSADASSWVYVNGLFRCA